MIVIKTNAKDLSDQLERDGQEFEREIETGFVDASRAIVDGFKTGQLSGRKSDDTALNVKTGNLRRSIDSRVRMTGRNIAATIFNKSATYWEYHQLGTERLKKRLFLFEEFATSGRKRYESTVETALKGLAR